MKTKEFTKLILIAFMFVFTGSLKAQTEFAPVGAEWYYEREIYNYDEWKYDRVAYDRFRSVDTITINGFLCKEIELFQNLDCDGNVNPYYETRYISQDGDRIYEVIDGERYLLYDFGKKIGEYWLLTHYNDYDTENAADTVFVKNITEITLEDGSTRRMFETSAYNTGSAVYCTNIIEGIGLDKSLFPFYQLVGPPPCRNTGIRCYSEDGDYLIKSDVECDYVPESVPFPYTPFPTENAQWSVNNEKYALHGDTIINEKKYSKVYKQTADEAFEFDIDKAEYFCAIRNDVENKRVYGVFKDNLEVYNHYNEVIEETESLLYDFSLNLGDTIEVANFDEADIAGYIQYVKYVRVESIGIYKFDGSHSYVTLYDTDSIFCLNNGEQRKRILLNGIHESLQQSWIEGIGSSDGPFVHAHFSGLEYMPKRLLCYNENDECLYKQSSFDYDEDDDCFTNYYPDNVVENNENDIMIYPNPATTNVEVSYTLPEGMTSATLVMTNTLGVNVKTAHLDGDNKTTLSLEELPSGIYFYTIRCGENVKTGKLIKK